MTYAVDGKQYIAIASGLFQRQEVSKAPERDHDLRLAVIRIFTETRTRTGAFVAGIFDAFEAHRRGALVCSLPPCGEGVLRHS
jgi:hypothetical protein